MSNEKVLSVTKRYVFMTEDGKAILVGKDKRARKELVMLNEKTRKEIYISTTSDIAVFSVIRGNVDLSEGVKKYYGVQRLKDLKLVPHRVEITVKEISE